MIFENFYYLCIMKRLIIIFLLIPTIGFSQTIVNNDLLLTNFKKILNDYRWMHRLNPVEIDKNLKGFTDNWAKEMGEMGDVSHGENENTTLNRVNRYEYIKPNTHFIENCTDMVTPRKNKIQKCKVVHPDGSPWVEYESITPYVEGSYSGKITQFQLAMYIFLLWKHSPSHDKGMLDRNVTRFYISSYRKGDLTYVSYIAIN